MASSSADGDDEPEQEIRLVSDGEWWVATDGEWWVATDGETGVPSQATSSASGSTGTPEN